MTTSMHVYCGHVRSGFQDAGVPVAEYIGRTYARWGQQAANEALYQYAIALLAVAGHPSWDPSRRVTPSVLYNPATDGIYFVLPLENGPIFFVSEAPIAPLARWTLLPHDGHDYREVEL